jgi:pimeloyl-ACP methyl ester carboxylesterase
MPPIDPRPGRHSPARKRATLALVVIAAMLSMTGCSFLGPFEDSAAKDRIISDDSSAGGPSIISMRPKPSAALSSYYAQRVSWSKCSDGLKCATLKVPIDWQHVTTESIPLALVEHPASVASLGTLVFNPGGPGESGVQFVKDGVDGAVDAAIEQDYDVVGFDPRGVGESNGVTCYDAKTTDAYFYDIDPNPIGSTAWINAEKEKARDFAAACQAGTGPVLGHIDTISAAADMDVIRAALGQKKLNYLGYSYGTYLGTVYAGLYPKNVGRMVLDGAEDPWGDDYESTDYSSNSDDYSVDAASDGVVAQAVAFEHDFTDYLKSCVKNASSAVGKLKCPFRTSEKSAESRVEAYLSAVGKHPLVNKDGRKLGTMTLALAIEESLYDPSDWPELTRMWAHIAEGNPDVAFSFADDYNERDPDGTYESSQWSNLAIGCLETGPAVDLKFDKREAAELTKVAPILGLTYAYSDLVCSGWKYGPSPFPNPIHAPGTSPILVLGTTGDPATPYADAQALTRQLDGAHLITLHDDGHTAYDRGEYCIDGIVDAYLLRGTVPTRDPECHP